MMFARRFMLGAGLLLAATNCLLAQPLRSRWSRPNLVKSNLVAPFSLFFERPISSRVALQANARWLRYSNRNPVEFVNLALEARIYFTQKAGLTNQRHPAGLYAGPYLKARSLTYINEIGYGFTQVGDLDEINIKSIGFGAVIGYQWIGQTGFTVDVFGGGGSMPAGLSQYQHTMRYGSVLSTNGFTIYTMDIRVGVSLGYAF